MQMGKLLALHKMASWGDDVPMHSVLSKRKLSMQQYVDQYVRPQMEWGLDAFCFHLAHGKQQPPGPMAFDAYHIARKRKMPWAKGFDKAIRPLTNDSVNGIRVICYMGSLDQGRMRELRDKPYGDDGYFVRFGQAIRPYVNAGCEIAFDGASRWKVDGPEHSFCRGLRDLGTPVHIEGTEFLHEPDGFPNDGYGPVFEGHLRDLPIIANHQHLWDNLLKQPGTHPTKRHDDPALYPKITTLLSGHSAPRNDDGTKMTTPEIHATAAKWAPPMLQQDLQAGYDCCMFMFPMILNTMTLEELITR